MTAVVGFLSFLGILVGLISIAVPLRFLGIHSRRMAVMVVATCGATFLAAMALDNRADGSAKGAKTASAPGQQALAFPIIDNGCQLAGALPNCEEEVAKLVAAKAANPTPFNHSGSPLAKQVNESSPARDYATDMMNEMKAREASANVRALAAQRRFDAAQYRIENANNRFERAMSNSDAVEQRYKLERDSLAYDRRIREREWERKRRGY